VIVLDASAAVELVTDTEIGARVARRLVGEAAVHIPTHCDLEVGSALRRAVLREELTARDAEIAFGFYRSARLSRWDIRPLLDRAWELIQAVAFADALYVALAESLDVPLITCDTRLARSRGHAAVIDLP
jgi:predicted nucleic acid-binding protein